ncbi:hypothetical protein CC85DRAFT_286686 [Cutaneotrichosporon oleaginosum]|uniref:Conserved oligomeric Golgi complex subunit 1 n=1 Tax=Cutaneotrichosporon oleaginosum TaxID=879819 RepID=A0A0J0XJG9_9TREE|nr:uncharacterized protein CC85DRAFT_286686 [Cutaneotrichosporon oleaginosum]KLT41250.1 hypothetical protein CC85DRAFT_286686 [Cutaneotrichosporon oleaginosum]TXT05512.1 hypothetical protein COLE_06832 [Cutaneotrichosporon oleaginosum]
MTQTSDTPSSLAPSGRGHRRRAALVGKEEEVDWATVDPDEVFRRLPVHEVKRVEAKMRADALNKQSELRSMVGTRYRDLLTSASQITALHSSSLRLSASLKAVGAACANPNVEVPEVEGEGVSDLLPVAAHVKLLLDAPEALYSHLAHHAYLNAAMLWLLARVVKDGLNEMPDDVKGPYVALMQKQWEVLLPFRGQIVSRATTALRSREPLEKQQTADTLLSLILLDGLSIDDALELLLSQRLRSLRDILAHGTGRRRSSTRRESFSQARKEGDVDKTLAEALRCILDTETLAHALFERRRDSSVIEDAIRLIQAGEEAPKPTPKTHNRRASRIASISLPLPPVVRSAAGPPTSASRVLSTMPASQILLRYLPPAVTGFTPFIAPSPTPSLSDRLSPWETQVVAILRDAVPSWLAGLTSVADVWALRSSTCDLLPAKGMGARISEAMEAEWGGRVQAIWTAKLDALVTGARDAVQAAADKIRSGVEVPDNNPASYTFSDITFPSASTLAGSSGAGFTSFLGNLKKRAAQRTPLLDSVLGGLEEAAADIAADLAGLAMGDGGRLGGALGALVHALYDVLSEAGGHRDKTGSVEAELFVGRVALFLAHGSSFLSDLGSSGAELERARTALMETHTESTIQWQAAAIDAALAALLPLFDHHRGPAQVRASWQGPHPIAPSPQLLAALTRLVSEVRRLGTPPGVSLETVPRLLKAFRAEARDLDGWEASSGEGAGELASQAAFDLAFLDLLTQDDIASDEVIKSLLDDVALGDFAQRLPELAGEALRRTQVVLYPLVVHLPQAEQGKRERGGALLRLGAPTLRGGVGAEFKSPLAVARPGKRFGLLSIVV